MKQIYNAVLELLKSGITPLMMGPPGIGKTQTAAKVAEALNLEFRDIRLSDYSGNDLAGYPFEKDGRMFIAAVDDHIFPQETTKVPDGKDGWLILLDELTTAEADTLKVALRILNERQIGNVKLHPKVHFVAAANPAGSGSLGYSLPDALIDRMAVLQCDYNFDSWLNWAKENNLNGRLIGELDKFRIDKEDFGPDEDYRDHPFISPRSLEQLSRYLNNGFNNINVMRAIVGNKMEMQLTNLAAYNITAIPEELKKFRGMLNLLDNTNGSALVNAIYVDATNNGKNGADAVAKHTKWLLENTPVTEANIQAVLGAHDNPDETMRKI